MMILYSPKVLFFYSVRCPNTACRVLCLISSDFVSTTHRSTVHGGSVAQMAEGVHPLNGGFRETQLL